MTEDFTFTIKAVRFDENYQPADNTRITTNFANLARGQNRRENLRNTLSMIDNRFNSLANWDNPNGNRYSVELEIITAEMTFRSEDNDKSFPIIEILNTNIADRTTGERIDGIAGNSLSSYVRDYDFSILLPDYQKARPKFGIPEEFGALHGKIFDNFLKSNAYKQFFNKPPVICLSVSSGKIYQRTGNQHPVLGVEYRQDEPSLTDFYFAKMGLEVRYFMPPNSVAPFAFYFLGDLLNGYTNLELISVISTMEVFQKIYRPEIYNANSIAGQYFQASLTNGDYSSTQIVYDREERNHLAVRQGKFAEEHFIKPYQEILNNWSANCVL